MAGVRVKEVISHSFDPL